MLKMFCEADGTPSMRRVLAFFCFVAFVVLALAAFRFSDAGWFVFIPAALALVAMLMLLFFTTWSDVASVVSAAKSRGGPRE